MELSVVGVVLVVTGGSDHSSSNPSSVAPTLAQLESATGLRLPSSISKYRTVRLDPSQVDVTFTIPPSDVDRLVSGSSLPPLSPARVITHTSPLWSLDPSGSIRGTSTTRDGAKIDLEVVSGDPAVVRLSVQAVSTTTTVQQ